jgi:hypothetical protein
LASTGGYYIPYQRLFVNDVYIDNLNKGTKDLRGDSNFPPNHFRLFRPAGVYEIKVTDHLGCGITQKVTLAAPPPLALTTQVQPATSNTSASVMLLAAGGSPPLECVLSGPGMDEIRQPDADFTNIIPGPYLARVVDAKNCYTNNGFIIGEPLSVTATVSNAKCGDDGSVSLVTSGGLPPFSFSIDHSPFQESPSFKNLGAGSYTVTAKDGQNTEATKIVTVAAPTEIVVVPSMFLPNMRVGATTDDKSVTADGFIHVQFDENSRKTSFKLKEGFDMNPTSSGIWVLTVTGNDPEDKKYEGKYQAYFNDCDVNMFIGFYRIDPTSPECTPDKWKEKATVTMLCKERWLPESEYAEIVKKIMIFVNGYRFYGKGAAGIIINSPKEYETTNNIVTMDAIDNYWASPDAPEAAIDLKFVERRRPDMVYYFDGHHSIATSNHGVANDVARSMKEKFIPGMLGSMMAKYRESDPVWIPLLPFITPYISPILLSWASCYQNEQCVKLSTSSNISGFEYRVRNGEFAFETLIPKLMKAKKPANSKITYHVDIVAHSMGFAYAQGIINAFKKSSVINQIKWRGYYIIAPENANAGTVVPEDWEQVWHYGSDLGRTDGIEADKLWDQDGVAPQFGIKGLPDALRTYIPKDKTIPKGFTESHSIGNYGWIFNIENPQTQGYVTPK